MRLSKRLSNGGAAEQRLQTIETPQQFKAEQDWLSSVATAYKRGGLLSPQPAAPLSREDSGRMQASNVCLNTGRLSGIQTSALRSALRADITHIRRDRCTNCRSGAAAHRRATQPGSIAHGRFATDGLG